MDILLAPVRVLVPLLLASNGELVGQRAGVLNLGIEGQMLLGAFLGWWCYAETDSLVLAFLLPTAAGLLLGAAFWFLVDLLECSQHVIGLGFGIASAGFAMTAYRSLSDEAKTYVIPSSAHTSDLLLVCLVGLTALAALLHFGGPRVTALRVWTILGVDLRAADLMGVRVRASRLACTAYAATMAMLGGASLSILITRSFTVGVVSGRGWIALSLVILSRWRPMLLLPAALFWGCIEVAQLHAQAAGIGIPYQALLMAPYLASLVVVLVGSRSTAPRTLLKTYRRDEDAA